MRILAEQYVAAMPAVEEETLTSIEVARMLEVSSWSVRWFAREQQITPCATTARGWRLFWKSEALRLVFRRAEARRHRVTALRPKKIGVPGEPRQMSLFGPKLRVVARDRSTTPVTPGAVGTPRSNAQGKRRV